MSIFTEEQMKEINKAVDEKLTKDTIHTLIMQRMNMVVDTQLGNLHEYLLKDLMTKLDERINYASIQNKAEKLLKEQIEQLVFNQVRDISRYDVREKADADIKTIVGRAVTAAAVEMDIKKLIGEALKVAVGQAINEPVSEIVKQHLGLVYTEFNRLKQHVDEIAEAYGRVRADVQDLKERR